MRLLAIDPGTVSGCVLVEFGTGLPRIIAGDETTFGHRLRSLRGEQGLTIVELAALADCGPKALGQWELGCTSPTARYLRGLCEALDMDPATLAWLVTGEGELG